MTDAVDARLEDGALVNVLGAVATSEAGRARAGVVADAIDARATVLARVGHAVVDVLRAEVAGESDRTAALVAVDQIETLFPVHALDRETLVDVVLAVHSLES